MIRGMFGVELSSRRPYGTASMRVERFPGISSRAIFASSLRDVVVARHWKNNSRRFGSTRQEVIRLTNLKHATKIDWIDEALRALGKRLYLDAA